MADLHIRKGNYFESRFSEYNTVFENAVRKIKELHVPNASIGVICGDIFHHKLQISSHGIILFETLLHSIADLMPLYVIQGNHDLIQENDDANNDLIFALLKNNPHPNITYCNVTTSFEVDDNLHIGVTSIRDILSRNVGSGLVCDLPPFPKPSEHRYNVALSHVTVQNALLHNYTKTNGGVPLEWFRGYDLVLLGDVHLQSAKFSKKHNVSYGYPGSLVQQDFGEGIYAHGFLVWNLNETGDALASVDKVHIYNPFGRANLKIENDGEVVINACNYESLDDFLKRSDKPSELHLRLYCKEYTNANDVRHAIANKLERHNLDFKIDVLTTSMLDASGSTNNASTSQLLESSMNNLRLGDALIEFYRQNCVEEILEANPEWESYIKHIQNVALCRSEIFNPKILELIDQKNSKLEKSYVHLVSDVQMVSTQMKNSLHMMEMTFDWILAFGRKNVFRFNDNRITLINAPNGFGKSAFFECITLGLFGETIPSRHNRSTSLSIMNCKRPFNVNNEVSRVRLTFRLNKKVYTIVRDFHEYTQNNKKRLHSLFTELYEDDALLYKSSKLVNAWVNEHVCSLSDFLLSSMITQNFDNDFFKLKPAEQNELFDSVLNMSTINDTIEVLKSAKKEYRDLKNHIDTFLNALRPSEEFDQEQYARCNDSYNNLTTSMRDLQSEYDDMLLVVDRKERLRVDLVQPEMSLSELLAKETELERGLSALHVPIGDFDRVEDIDEFDTHDLTMEQFVYDDDDTIVPQSKQVGKLFEAHKTTPIKTLVVMIRKLSDRVDFEKYTLQNVLSQIPQKRSKHRMEDYQEFQKEFTRVKNAFSKVENTAVIERPNFHASDLVKPHPNNTKLHSLTTEELEQLAVNATSLRGCYTTREEDGNGAKAPAFNPDCWACNQNFTSDNDAREVLRYRERLRHITQWELYEKNKPVIEQHTICTYEEKMWLTNLPLIEAWERWETHRNEQEKACQAAVQERVNFVAALRDVLAYQTNYNRGVGLAKQLQKVRRDKRFYQNTKLELKYQIDAHHKAIIETQARLTKLELLRSQEESYREQLACLNVLMHTLDKRIGLFSHFVDVFAKYKSWIYNEKLLPAIVFKTNQILSHMFHDREVRLRFELDTGDKVLFTVLDEGNRIHIEKLSGAQSFAVSLSFRLALSSVGITRFHCDQLFIDEGFCSFDKTNLLNVPELIKNLKQLYAQIVLVTHLDEIKDCADEVVNITRQEGISRLSNTTIFL